ncbi:MAG: hypothetical protein M1828_006631 [Chrysothrix sp. TS-e1954]|nr:MAG: hypothetical protein M1828_006631 [Chrysothrix sp. TS-e1954]
MGATQDPSIDFLIQMSSPLQLVGLAHPRITVADVVGNKLASDAGSFAAFNAMDQDVQIEEIVSLSPNVTANLLESSSLDLVSGQTRPVAFRLEVHRDFALAVRLEVRYTHKVQSANKTDDVAHTSNFVVSFELRKKSINEVHKLTYVHSGGIVSYSMLRPPSEKALHRATRGQRFPVFINLHGAGLEADDPTFTQSLDGVPDLAAWTLFPSGVTPWSGDDWHDWALRDVESAISALPRWIDRLGWTGLGVEAAKWLVCGHSNGGQGVLYFVSHRPDNIIAAAQVSGYSSIQQYVPYQFWREIDPALSLVIHASLNNYRHELLVPTNMKGIDLMQQHGSADDNVPCFHARRMQQLIFEAGNTSQYVELAGKGHWFDGIMTTAPLRDFYEGKLIQASEGQLMQASEGQVTPESFTLTVASPVESGPKFGFRIEDLSRPGQLGKVHVKTSDDGLSVTTSNVLRFSLDCSAYASDQLTIDGQFVALDRGHHTLRVHLMRRDLRWQAVSSHSLQEPKELGRHKYQSCGMQSILHTKSAITIFIQDASLAYVALQISRNLHQYYGADAVVRRASSSGEGIVGNVITLKCGDQTPGQEKQFPVRVEQAKVIIQDDQNQTTREYEAGGEGISTAFLHPLPQDRIGLVIWGQHKHSLEVAARLAAPTITGAGQPDFVVLTDQCLRKGTGAVLAAGLFDSFWRVSTMSYFT